MVLLFDVVGLDDALQHTPRAVTGAPPSLTLPPLVAETIAMFDTASVIREGNWEEVCPQAGKPLI